MKLDDQLKLLRSLASEMGWGPFMRHAGSLMAEQSDKLNPDGEQSKALFDCSRTVHTLDPFFEKCGKFEYPEDMVLPPNSKVLLRRDPTEIIAAGNGFKLASVEADNRGDFISATVSDLASRSLLWAAGMDSPTPDAAGEPHENFMTLLKGAIDAGKQLEKKLRDKEARDNN